MRNIQIGNKNDITPKHKCEKEPYEYYKYEITKRSRENQCEVYIYEIPPQRANYPYHYHFQNEEIFYIISGTGLLETPDGNKEITAGDTIVCPPLEKGAHRIINTSQIEMLVYLDVDTVHYPEVVCHPNSNKIGILNENSNDFYKKNTTVNYYEGE